MYIGMTRHHRLSRFSRPDPATTSEDSDATRARSRGQALVEFAIVLPLFFLLVAGTVDLGLAIYSDLTVANAAREGARLGVVDPGNTAAIEARVRDMAGNLDAGKLDVKVSCERLAGASFIACSAPMWQPGDATVVRADYRHAVYFPLVFGTEIPVSSEMRMRIE